MEAHTKGNRGVTCYSITPLAVCQRGLIGVELRTFCVTTQYEAMQWSNLHLSGHSTCSTVLPFPDNMSTVYFAYGTGDQSIYTGVWVNWSQGRIFGATITLTSRDGALLVTFLALFVSLVETSFWRIVCLALHRYVYSTEAGMHSTTKDKQSLEIQPMQPTDYGP